VAEGLLVEGLTAADRARLDFYEGGFGLSHARLAVRSRGRGGGHRAGLLSRARSLAPGAPWRLADWAARWGAVTATAADVMALMGQSCRRGVLGARYAMLVRAGQPPAREAEAAPATLRRDARPGDVDDRRAQRSPMRISSRSRNTTCAFAGSTARWSDPVNRAAFVSGDAVTVLPYDPVRDRVLLVEQFRAGPFARGDRQPLAAGGRGRPHRPRRNPEGCARREALEEAGSPLGDLIEVGPTTPARGQDRISLRPTSPVRPARHAAHLGGWRTRPRISAAMSSPSRG
jgi:ADP-ribose pyrophosphatase